MPGARLPWVLGLAFFLAVVGAATQDDSDNPHAYMDKSDACSGCHRAEEGRSAGSDPHVFAAPVTDICRGCHPPEQTGRSHKVGSDPRRALKRKDSPAELPLQWSDEARTEVMTCGTCHNPHLPRFSDQKLYSRQRPHAGSSDSYLTYFLRIRGSTPREGFMPLCHACHPGL